MAAIHEQLEQAFTENGYEVLEASDNRGRIRIALDDPDLDQETVTDVAAEIVDREQTIGWNVTAERLEGQDGISTVLTFKDRS